MAAGQPVRRAWLHAAVSAKKAKNLSAGTRQPGLRAPKREISLARELSGGGDGNRTPVQGFAGPCLNRDTERTTGFEPATLTLAR